MHVHAAAEGDLPAATLSTSFKIQVTNTDPYLLVENIDGLLVPGFAYVGLPFDVRWSAFDTNGLWQQDLLWGMTEKLSDKDCSC